MNWLKFEQIRFKLPAGGPEVTRATVLLLTLTLLTASSALQARAASVDTLENGLEVIYVENHASPLAASVVYVRSGSRYESVYENGITHFLEHLLFDGTVHMSREELDNSIQRLGGYINAFTTKDLTAYLVVLPQEYLGYGLAVQADMLFNSTFPEHELEKERKVVIEEINRSADSPGAPAEAFFDACAFAGSGYARPVLGYRGFIENLPRRAVVDYWKTHYTPERMTVLLIGDFETSQMAERVAAAFGTIAVPPDTTARNPLAIHRRLAEGKQRPGRLNGAVRHDTVGAVMSTYVGFSFEAPKVDDRDYVPFDVLARYLNADGISPLKRALESGGRPLAREISVSLATMPDFSRLNVEALLPDAEAADTVIALVLTQLEAMAETGPDSTALEGVKTSVRCEAIFNLERLHYLGFMVAPQVMAGGWNFVEDYPGRVVAVNGYQCRAAAGRWLAEPNYVVTVMKPVDSTQTPYTPLTMPAEQIITYFDTARIAEHDLSVGYPILFPVIDSIVPQWDDPAVYRREVLSNGLTVVVRSSEGNATFGATLLGRNRTMREPDGQTGITDFVNRCLEKGTRSRPAQVLAQDLAAIGAELTLYDNPWIPYDDRYTTRSYSFVKLQAIDDYAEDGLMLLADVVNNPAFDSAAAEIVRADMLAALQRNARSPQKTASDLFYATLFGDGPFARPIMGTAESISGITRQDLQKYHELYYAPDNTVLALSTRRDTSEVMDWVRTFFGYRSPGGIDSSGVPGTKLMMAVETATRPFDAQQAALYAGGRLPGAAAAETTDLEIAAEILSDRLYKNLRERQGLAYSTGATATFDRSVGWYYTYIACSSENYPAARNGLELQTDKLAFDGPTAEEVRRAANQIWGQMMRAKMTRVNQAYYQAVDEFLGFAPGRDRLLVEQLGAATADEVRQAASQYFRPALWVIAAAGNVPQ